MRVNVDFRAFVIASLWYSLFWTMFEVFTSTRISFAILLYRESTWIQNILYEYKGKLWIIIKQKLYASFRTIQQNILT